ncbi:MAG: hypothetical protein HIU93_01665 [Acidobacteria bacterium]|nr:hypothetical protein [Acidobacteriota bacterium]MBW4043995.1 hypothetical protein [Acidobacteriota bacterium]
MSYFLATVHFVLFYIVDTKEYLNIPKYIAGLERLPYQRRLLMMLVLRAFRSNRLILIASSHFRGSFHNPDLLICGLIYFCSLAIAGITATLLYESASKHARYKLAVYPFFLACAAWTYLVNNEAFGRYIYDIPALAFFTAGIYLIYTKKYFGLALLIAVGTLNRETTVLLVPIYFLTAYLHMPLQEPIASKLKALPWFKSLLLGAIWLSEKAGLSRLYRKNDASESFVHLHINIHLLTPGHWPQIFSACAFLLPLLWMLRNKISDRAVTATIYVFPLWVIIMMIYGLIIESRIFGELCGYCAVGCVLLLDRESGMHTLQEDEAALA